MIQKQRIGQKKSSSKTTWNHLPEPLFNCLSVSGWLPFLRLSPRSADISAQLTPDRPVPRGAGGIGRGRSSLGLSLRLGENKPVPYIDPFSPANESSSLSLTYVHHRIHHVSSYLIYEHLSGVKAWTRALKNSSQWWLWPSTVHLAELSTFIDQLAQGCAGKM